MQREHANIPVDYLVRTESLERRCELIPGLFDIYHQNIYWQETQLGTMKLLLYSAFLDTRDKKGKNLVCKLKAK